VPSNDSHSVTTVKRKDADQEARGTTR